MARIRAVAIITKRKNTEAKTAAEKIARMLGSRGIATLAISPLRLKGCDMIDPADVKDRADLVFAIGGDGTTLKAFRTIPADVLHPIQRERRSGLFFAMEAKQPVEIRVEKRVSIDQNRRVGGKTFRMLHRSSGPHGLVFPHSDDAYAADPGFLEMILNHIRHVPCQ